MLQGTFCQGHQVLVSKVVDTKVDTKEETGLS